MATLAQAPREGGCSPGPALPCFVNTRVDGSMGPALASEARGHGRPIVIHLAGGGPDASSHCPPCPHPHLTPHTSHISLHRRGRSQAVQGCAHHLPLHHPQLPDQHGPEPAGCGQPATAGRMEPPAGPDPAVAARACVAGVSGACCGCRGGGEDGVLVGAGLLLDTLACVCDADACWGSAAICTGGAHGGLQPNMCPLASVCVRWVCCCRRPCYTLTPRTPAVPPPSLRAATTGPSSGSRGPTGASRWQGCCRGWRRPLQASAAAAAAAAGVLLCQGGTAAAAGVQRLAAPTWFLGRWTRWGPGHREWSGLHHGFAFAFFLCVFSMRF